MKIKVELSRWDGVVMDGESNVHCEPDYEIVDADTGRFLLDDTLHSYEEVEANVATNFPDCERWIPPEATPQETAFLENILAMAEKSPGKSSLDPLLVRKILVSHLYETGHPTPVVARIRAVLERLSVRSGKNV